MVRVCLGSAAQDDSVCWLWKVLRHEAPRPAETAERLGIAAQGEPLAQVIKTYHPPHRDKLALAAIWRGTISEGDTLDGVGDAGVVRLCGHRAGTGWARHVG